MQVEVSASANAALQIYVMSPRASALRDWLLPACGARGNSLKSRSPVKYEIPERRSV